MTWRGRVRPGKTRQGLLLMEQTPKAIPELSLDTQTVERLLSGVAIGEIMPYTTLTAAVGRDVQQEARGCLRTARIRLHRSRAMVFGAVTGIGLKRLDDQGKIAAAHGHARRGRRQYRMAVRTVAAVDDFAALPNDQKVQHSLIAAQAGAILQMTTTRRAKRLEASVADHLQKAFSPKESLALMKASI